jgi:hypothetical protein
MKSLKSFVGAASAANSACIEAAAAFAPEGAPTGVSFHFCEFMKHPG